MNTTIKNGNVPAIPAHAEYEWLLFCFCFSCSPIWIDGYDQPVVHQLSRVTSSRVLHARGLRVSTWFTSRVRFSQLRSAGV